MADLFTPTRRPQTAAQRVMAAKPTLKQIERAHAVQLDAWAHQDVKLLREPFPYRGWIVRMYESWITSGWIYVQVEAAPLPGGRPGQHDSAEFATEDEAKVWLKDLPDATASTPPLHGRDRVAA